MRQSLRINQYIFQSTLSVRRATKNDAGRVRHFDISIHALREESDNLTVTLAAPAVISIHALREESDSARA